MITTAVRAVLLVAALMLFSERPTLAASTAPDNGWVVWASNRQAGRHEIYLMKANGGGDPVRLTSDGGQYPAWSPDGSWIAYQHTADSTTHVIRVDGSDDHEVCKGVPVFWMHDNSGVVCAVLRTDWVGFEGMSRSDQYLIANPYLGTSAELFKRSDFRHLTDNYGSYGDRHFIPGGITHDGRFMVAWVFGLFELGYTADNGRFTSSHSSVVLDLQDKTKLYYLGPGCTTTTPPTGDLVYHVSREGETAPDIFSLNVNDLQTRSSYQKVMGRADADWGHDYFPRISNDNRWLTYGASTNCHPWYECDYEIFLHELGTDTTQSIRLTTNPANDNYPHMFVGDPLRAEPNARIALTPSRVALAGTSEAPPASRRVTVVSSGAKPLGTVETKVVYSSGTGWLSVSATDTGKYTDLLLEAKTASLPTGKYSATIEISAAEAVNSPQKLEVQLAFVSSRDAGADAAPDSADAVTADAAAPDAGADGAAAAEDARPGDAGTPAEKTSGCDCHLAGAAPPGSVPAVLLAALAFVLIRKRTWRRRSPATHSRSRCTKPRK